VITRPLAELVAKITYLGTRICGGAKQSAAHLTECPAGLLTEFFTGRLAEAEFLAERLPGGGAVMTCLLADA
jgi:hypothetical protein